MNDQVHSVLKRLMLLIAVILSFNKISAYDFEVDGLCYNKLSSNQVEVTYRYEYDNNYSGTLVIPEKVKYSGKEFVVSAIGDKAFSMCSGLTGSLVIPNSVTKIGYCAFFCCSGFTGSLTIPNSVTSIGAQAFDGCNNLTGSLIIPNSVTIIRHRAFKGCKFTGSLIIPNAITTIEENVFYGCSGFTGSLIIPSSVTSIGDGAFYGCSGFTGSLIIPSLVTSIGSESFYGCKGLTSLVLPSSVTSIGYRTFMYCKNLSYVESQMETPFSFGDDVFVGIASNAILVIPKGENYPYGIVKYFAEVRRASASYILSISSSGNGYASYNGTSIRNKTTDFSLTEGTSPMITFTPDNGYRIKSVKVNNKTVSVSNNQYTISNISANTTVSVEFEAIPVTTYTLSITASGNGSASYGSTTIRSKTSTFTVNAGSSATITFTPDNGYRIKSVKVNNSTVSVSNNQYTISSINANTTVSVEFEAIPVTTYTLSITASGNGSASFSGTTVRSKTSSFTVNAGSSATITFSPDNGYRIKSVKVNNVVVSVSNNQYTISNISQNTTIEVAFANSPTTGKFEVDGLYYNILSNDQVEVTYDDDHSYTGQITIPEKVKYGGKEYSVIAIGKSAFYWCKDLTGSLTLPNSIISIGDYAFQGCKNLTGPLVLPASVQSIGLHAFDGCSGFRGTLKIPETVTSIKGHAFSGCSGLTGSLEIPSSITTIEECSFANCSGFTRELIIPNSVTSIGYGAFLSCSGLSGVLVIPNSVKIIRGYAFAYCKGFTGSLVIPYDIKAIEESTFRGCEGLTGALTIPNQVTTIGEFAFEKCWGIDGKLTIPNSVISIGKYAFLNCWKLAQVESQIENPYNIDGVFQGISSSSKLQVPKGTKYKYEALSGWTDYFNEIVEMGAIPITYTLSIMASGNGSVTYNGTTIRSQTSTFTVNEGNLAKILFTPDDGYQINAVKVNGSTVSVINNEYTVSSISENTTVEVEFVEQLNSFEYEGVNYNIVSRTDRIVYVAAGDYGKVLEVPWLVNYQDMGWLVDGVENGAFDNNTDLAAIIWHPDTTFKGQVSNPNLLLYVSKEHFAPSNIKNVVVNGTANSITLTDAAGGNNFYCPQEFTAQRITYTHNYSMKTGIGEARGWETIALPFDVQKVTHESKGEIVSFANWRSGDSKRPFWLMQLSGNGWTMATSIKASTPYIISMPYNDEYKAGFLLNGRVTFSAENVNIPKTENLSTVNYSDRTFVPTFSSIEKSNDVLALNVVNDIERVIGGSTEGSTFERNLRPVHPFEAYMTSTSSTRSIAIDEGMATGIIELISALSDEGDLRIYNLNGQLIKIEEGRSMDEVIRELPAGVYIVNGKKMIIR